MNPMKILLVDDSKSARYALRLQLQRHGTEVETADSAESALERIRQSPPDAVFMDHTMPGMNGFEALEILKSDSTTAHIPVVMCTSNEEPEFIAQARRKGALDILAKSASPEKLADLLARLQDAVVAPSATVPAPAVPATEPPSPAVAETAAKVARGEAERVLAEQLDQRLQALLEQHLQPLSERLEAKVLAQTQDALAARIGSESGNLEKRLAHDLGEQTQRATDRLAKDILPTMVRQQLEEVMPALLRQELEHERTGIAQLAQELIDSSVDRLPEDPAFLRRLREKGTTTAVANTHETVRRHAREVAEEAASERAGALTESLRRATRSNQRLSYILASAAALIGIAAAGAVYLLLQ
jgi:CheY-like chemotaxis protein